MAKKIPIPKTKKSGSSFPWTRLQLGLASILNRNPLTLGKIPGANTAAYGNKAWRANQLANMAQMGKWSGRLAGLGRFGVMNPWFMVPAALLGGAKYAVSKSFAPYKDAEGNWTKEGLEQMSQERLAREDLAASRRAEREGTWLGKLDERMLNQLSNAGMSEGGIARLL